MPSRICRPRTPPALLISSAASFTPCTVAWPYAASLPLVAAYTPPGISFAGAAVWRSATGRQPSATTVAIHTENRTKRLKRAESLSAKGFTNFMQANDLRRGMVIIWDGGDLCKVMEFHHHTPGNLRAMVQAKLRN